MYISIRESGVQGSMDRIQHVRERWKARVYTLLLIHFQRKSSNSFDENRDKWLTVLISRLLSPIERAVSGTVRLQHAGKSPSLRLMTHFLFLDHSGDRTTFSLG